MLPSFFFFLVSFLVVAAKILWLGYRFIVSPVVICLLILFFVFRSGGSSWCSGCRRNRPATSPTSPPKSASGFRAETRPRAGSWPLNLFRYQRFHFFFIWSKTNDVHRCLCWLEQVLLDYLLVEGYPAEEFKVLSSWPRKDVSLFSALLFSCSLKPN